MSSIRWTPAGAVAAPRTLQVRVTAGFEGRVAAGAPTPTRAMTPAEIDCNIRHFTAGMRGPRTQPCDALVLSGVTSAAGSALLDVLAAARAEGMARITLHLPRGWGEPGPLTESADAVALTVVTVHDLAGVPALSAAAEVTVVVVLDHAGLAELEHTLDAVAAARPGRVVLTWPLLGPPPPTADRVLAKLAGAVAPLDAAGIPYGVKGLPPCAVRRRGAGEWVESWRSSNRWYVDADHQCGQALLFFPDVVRFAKADACRFCAVSSRCDGVVAGWLAAGLAGTLVPVTTTDPLPVGHKDR